MSLHFGTPDLRAYRIIGLRTSGDPVQRAYKLRNALAPSVLEPIADRTETGAGAEAGSIPSLLQPVSTCRRKVWPWPWGWGGEEEGSKGMGRSRAALSAVS